MTDESNADLPREVLDRARHAVCAACGGHEHKRAAFSRDTDTGTVYPFRPVCVHCGHVTVEKTLVEQAIHGARERLRGLRASWGR